MFRDDYLIRLIEQLGEALRRIAGLSSKGDHAGALHAAQDAWHQLLGIPRDVVDVIDTPALAAMLREPDKIRCAARLLAEEARALRGANDPVHAAICTRHAMELVLEARALDPSESDDATLAELSRTVHANQLDPRYQR